MTEFKYALDQHIVMYIWTLWFKGYCDDNKPVHLVMIDVTESVQ